MADRVRRVVSPSHGARLNAAQALEEITSTGDELVLHGSNLDLFAGHPAGLSQRRAAGRLGTALWETFPAHVALLDRDGVVVSVNRAWREFGLSNGGGAATGVGTNYLHVCDRAAAAGEPEAAEAADLVRTALGGAIRETRLTYAAASTAGTRWFSVQAIPIPGRHSGALVVHTDTTADRQREREWQHRALHDPLTGLPNRALLSDRLEHAVAAAARDPRSLGVLFVDLDDFKAVNDTAGHAAGDQVLAEVATRMAGSVRAADTLGRWGGDEFLVIAERLDSSTTAADVAGRLTASLNEPVSIGTSRQARPGGLVFVGPKGGPLRGSTFGRSVWRPAVAGAGLPGLHFHDLRGFAATLAAISGATTAELMRRLGHSTVDMALRYQRATSDRDAAIARALSDHVTHWSSQ